MTHFFLLVPGRWHLDGSLLERNHSPINFQGKTMIVWNQDDWFTMVTKLIFTDDSLADVTLQYRGKLGQKERQYTYVLQHSQLGRVEGEGWISDNAIIQRYWVLDDRQRRSGFETFYRINEDQYRFAGGMLAGHYLTSTMEAILERQG